MGGFNTYGEKSKKYGGAYPVWLTVSQKERSGGVLETLPEKGTVLRAGSLVSVDGAGGIAKVIETFEVAENLTATATEVQVRAYGCHPKPKGGMFLMKVPKDLITKGQGVAVTNLVYDDKYQVYRFDITANQLGVLTKGDILVRATQAGGNATIYAVPSGLTENDVWVEDGDKTATIASVYHGEIMEDRIQPIPEIFKSVLPMIKFQKGI